MKHNDITKEQADRLINIYKKYKSLFMNTIGTVPNFIARFELISEPSWNRTYPCPESMQDKMAKYIDELLQLIIERSEFNYISSLIPIKKPDYSIRGCLDLRNLNKFVKETCVRSQEMEVIL